MERDFTTPKWGRRTALTIRRIVLSTQPANGAVLSKILRGHNPTLEVSLVSEKAALAALADSDLGTTRLLSFCSPLIVPARLLAALPGPSYNFHPGPPDRPGRFPSVFAIYEQAEQFGVTVHEMTKQVDSGPIVAVEWFAIPEGADVFGLEKLTLGCMVAMFKRMAPFLAQNPKPLPRVVIPWSGTKRSKTECDEICRLSPDMSEAEIARRKRACGSLLKS